MEYKEGYLAFIDILGFSKYVEDESNAEKTANLFEFINKFSLLFNSMPDLEVEVSFFSDTIIITSRDIEKLVIPINLAEAYLKSELNLLFRGSIVKGKYYHTKGTTFGPAVVKGYRLEKQAKYARIIIDKDIEINEEDILYHKDWDGYICLNPYIVAFFDIVDVNHKDEYSKEEILDSLKKVFREKKKEIIDYVFRNKDTEVVDKYLWRVTAYNGLCRSIIKESNGEIIFKDLDLIMSDKLREIFNELIISVEELI